MVAYKVKKITKVDTSSLEALGQSVVDLSKYTEDEFGIVSQALQATDPDPVLNTPPPKPRRGTYAYADGTHWNPGAGEGPYYFKGSLPWVPMWQTSTSPIATDAPSDGNAYGRNNGVWVPVVVSVKKQIFTASGTYTPSAGMLYCIIECVGGGGGGGGAVGAGNWAIGGGGGGGGGYSRKIASAATIGASQTVTIGAAGSAGSPSVNGGAGGTTSVGTLCVANGGGGGTYANNAVQIGSPGGGGAAGTGDLAVPGMPGACGSFIGVASATLLAVGGFGGSSLFGAGGYDPCALGGSANGISGGGFGAGASGAATNVGGLNPSGAAGSSGVVFITEFCSQ